MSENGLTARQLEEITEVVRKITADAGDNRELAQKIEQMKSALASLEERVSAQSASFMQSSNALLNSVTNLVDDFKMLHTKSSDIETAFQAKHLELEERLRDFEDLVKDYPSQKAGVQSNASALADVKSEIEELKKPILKRWRFWAVSSSTVLVILAFFFGDGFFQNDPVLPYYMHKFLRTESGIAQSLKVNDESDLRAGLDTAAVELVRDSSALQALLVRKAHEKPVYAFHGAQWFQQQFVRIPHPACLAREHPGINLLVEYSLYIAQEEIADPSEYAGFVASVSEFDCTVAKGFPLATSASLEIPFYGRPGTDDIALEILVNYSVWDDAESAWTEQTIKIDKFDVSVNGGLKIPSESFEKLQPLGGVYRADISALMQDDPNSRRYL